MTTTSPVTARPAPAPTSPNWSRPVRYAAAAALAGSGLLWFLAELLSLAAGEDELRWSATHPTLSGLGLVADMVSVPLLFGATVVWFALSRAASARLAWTGAGLLTLGTAGQGILVGVEVAGYLLARNAPERASALSSALDGAGGLPLAVFMVMFFGGAFVGILVTMVAVWRARAFPLGAILLVLAFQAAELLDVPGPMTAIAFAGLTWMALHLVRTDSGSGSAHTPRSEPV